MRLNMGDNTTKAKAWLLATRPKTLPAAMAPVIVGTSLAAHQDSFEWYPALACLLFALLIQVATNYANDYFDFKKGTDNENRIGPKRAVAQGWIKPKTMLLATIAILTLAFGVGIQLIPYGGTSLIIIGLLSIAFAILYTGGPFPLAYLGLGDLFVLIFFGWVAVMFTFMVQSGFHSLEAFLLGTSTGMLSVNLLLINNYRDVENDRESRKFTTVVRFGKGYGRYQHSISNLLVIACTSLVALRLQTPVLMLATVPGFLSFFITKKLKSADGEEIFADLLKKTAVLLVLYAMLVFGTLIF